jgi:hypothetical protein
MSASTVNPVLFTIVTSRAMAIRRDGDLRFVMGLPCALIVANGLLHASTKYFGYRRIRLLGVITVRQGLVWSGDDIAGADSHKRSVAHLADAPNFKVPRHDVLFSRDS